MLGFFQRERPIRTQLILITGCSSGGKSTLLSELESRGYDTVDEPGRRIVRREMKLSGAALPWIDLQAFAEQALELAYQDIKSAVKQTNNESNYVFFDRGMIDAALALETITGVKARDRLEHLPRYDPTVFLAPPWPEIFVPDKERRHSFEDASREYEHIASALPFLGYETVVLPKLGVSERAKFLIQTLTQNT